MIQLCKSYPRLQLKRPQSWVFKSSKERNCTKWLFQFRNFFTTSLAHFGQRIYIILLCIHCAKNLAIIYTCNANTYTEEEAPWFARDAYRVHIPNRMSGCGRPDRREVERLESWHRTVFCL